MFHEEFVRGGPVMYALFGVWVFVLALILDRILFWAGWWLQPHRRPERMGALRQNLRYLDALTHLATSLGLFGTVLGLTRTFFARGTELALSAPEVLAAGLATALYTTVAGLAIFLVGQSALLLFGWWAERAEAALRRAGALEKP